MVNEHRLTICFRSEQTKGRVRLSGFRLLDEDVSLDDEMLAHILLCLAQQIVEDEHPYRWLH